MIRIYESVLADIKMSKSELERVFLNHHFIKSNSVDSNVYRFVKKVNKLGGKTVVITTEYDDLSDTYTLTLSTYANIDFAYISDEISTVEDLENWFKFKYPLLIDKMVKE